MRNPYVEALWRQLKQEEQNVFVHRHRERYLQSLSQHYVFTCSFVPHNASTGFSMRAPGEPISKLFNLHYNGLRGEEAAHGLNVFALLNPLSKARCCWCGSSKVHSKCSLCKNCKYTMAVKGHIFAMIHVFLLCKYTEGSLKSAWKCSGCYTVVFTLNLD